jgi:SAM-dependent methyltransferase
MELRPAIDTLFYNASPFLKSVLKYDALSKSIFTDHCLDIPCGNGRNTFLLALHAERVTAIDIGQKYLDSLCEAQIEYQQQNIETIQLDVLNQPLNDLEKYGLVCNIHFYHESLIRQLLTTMRKDALLLLETPACHGENFRMLPNEFELNELLKGYHVLRYEFKTCKHTDNQEQRGVLKALIKI